LLLLDLLFGTCWHRAKLASYLARSIEISNSPSEVVPRRFSIASRPTAVYLAGLICDRSLLWLVTTVNHCPCSKTISRCRGFPTKGLYFSLSTPPARHLGGKDVLAAQVGLAELLGKVIAAGLPQHLNLGNQAPDLKREAVATSTLRRVS
jgi:hypothetical protein